MKYDKYALWLPSWYPNLLEPLNGDFIQRHAQATSLFCKITVMHFTQYGEGVKQERTFETISTSNQLKEVVSYLAFKPTGIRLLDKLRYNYAYYQHAKKYLAAYFEEFGLPEIVHVHVPMKAGNLALWIKRKYGINYIVSEHSSYYLKSATGNFFERSFLYRKQVNVIFKGAQAVTNVSSTIGNLLCQLFQLKTVRTVHNVVNTEYFNYSASRNQLFTYIHVSTLNEQKNINGILQVFSKLMAFKSDWKLVLVGPYTNDLIKKYESSTYKIILN